MSIQKQQYKKYNRTQSAHNRRLQYRDPAAGGGYGKADTEAISNKGSAAGLQGLQGRAPDTGPAPGEEALAGGLRGCSLPEADRRRRRGYREITDRFSHGGSCRLFVDHCGSSKPAHRCSRILNTVYIV